MTLGRSIRSLWHLAGDGVFLNHGSFGACPKEILAEQDRIRARMEDQPDRFFRSEIQPDSEASTLRAAAAKIAAFVGAAAGDVAFVENATAGTQAVLRSMDFGPSDRILVTDHGYNAVRLMVEARCAETGATPLVVKLPMPVSADDVVARIAEAVTPAVRLAIVDHITSPTALVFPLERLIPELRRHGARVFVDGAHAIGQVPLDLAALGADWYVTNAHKWLYAPKGTAILHARADAGAITRPHVISHFAAAGFPRAFDYLGTRDNSAWLAAPAALAFFERLGPATVQAHERALIEKASDHMAALGLEPVAPIGMCAAMRTFVLKKGVDATREDAARFMRRLWDEARIQVAAMALNGDLLLRISAQAYVDDEDLARLREALPSVVYRA